MKTGSRFTTFLCTTAAAVAIAAIPCAGQDASAPTGGQDGIVAVGGVTILTIRLPAAGMPVKQRADAVNARLRQLLADPTLKPSDVETVSVGKYGAQITVKNRLLVMVEPETARLSDTTPIKLANMWAVHLRKVLPQLNVRPNPNDKGNKKRK